MVGSPWKKVLRVLDFQLSLEKQQAERRKWLEEKLLLIGQAKEAEERRNQDMRRFAEDRERFTRQQSQLVSRVGRGSAVLQHSIGHRCFAQPLTPDPDLLHLFVRSRCRPS